MREIDADLRRFMDSYSVDERNILKIDQKIWAKVVDDWEIEPSDRKLPFIGSIIRESNQIYANVHLNM